MEKYNVSLRKLLQQGISEPEFYADLVYRIRKIVGESNFSEQFRKLINRYKIIGYNPYIMRQTACLVVNPITVESYALYSLTLARIGYRFSHECSLCFTIVIKLETFNVYMYWKLLMCICI